MRKLARTAPFHDKVFGASGRTFQGAAVGHSQTPKRWAIESGESFEGFATQEAFRGDRRQYAVVFSGFLIGIPNFPTSKADLASPAPLLEPWVL